MQEPTDATELRRRRRFMVEAGLLSGLIAAGGALMGVLGGDRGGYFITASFGVFAIIWAGRLLTQPEVVLELPAYHFSWFDPSRAGTQNRQSEMRTTEKPTHRMPELSPSVSRVWDRELDDTL